MQNILYNVVELKQDKDLKVTKNDIISNRCENRFKQYRLFFETASGIKYVQI